MFCVKVFGLGVFAFFESASSSVWVSCVFVCERVRVMEFLCWCERVCMLGFIVALVVSSGLWCGFVCVCVMS